MNYRIDIETASEMDCLTLTLDTEGQNRKFMLPYKNEDGYFACLFGEHLIYDELKGKKL